MCSSGLIREYVGTLFAPAPLYSYGYGGYGIELPNNRREAEKILRHLQQVRTELQSSVFTVQLCPIQVRADRRRQSTLDLAHCTIPCVSI